jgi:SAM-dependent methyltransferase
VSDTPSPQPGSRDPHRENRQQLKTTFAKAAGTYQTARPEYPDELFDDLIASVGLRVGDSILEVGCATGKATIPLARRGFSLRCVELSEDLAAAARQSLTNFPRVKIETASFEEWDAQDETFDLLIAATSWHWIDPAIRYNKAANVLKPGGHLAIWAATHVFPEGGDPFFRQLQDVYDEIDSGDRGLMSYPRPGDLEDLTDEIEGTQLFSVILIKHYDWELVYDAESYIALLKTFSDHIAREPWQQDRLYGEIRRRLAERESGTVRRHWGTVLQVAKRL